MFQLLRYSKLDFEWNSVSSELSGWIKSYCRGLEHVALVNEKTTEALSRRRKWADSRGIRGDDCLDNRSLHQRSKIAFYSHPRKLGCVKQCDPISSLKPFGSTLFSQGVKRGITAASLGR
jgi:hypothetical protein